MKTIKNVTEGEKKSSKSSLDFIVPGKLTSTSEEEKEGEKKKNPQNKSKHKNNKCFS